MVNNRSNYFGKTAEGAFVKLTALPANGPSAPPALLTSLQLQSKDPDAKSLPEVGVPEWSAVVLESTMLDSPSKPQFCEPCVSEAQPDCAVPADTPPVDVSVTTSSSPLAGRNPLTDPPKVPVKYVRTHLNADVSERPAHISMDCAFMAFDVVL